MSNKLPYLDHIKVREQFDAHNTIHGKTIYLIAIVLLFSGIGLLPVIKVPLSIQGRGIIRPLIEKTAIICPKYGQVDRLFIAEGQFVNKGDTLLKISSNALVARKHQALQELVKIEEFLSDLECLNHPSTELPVSELYAGQHHLFIQKTEELEMKIELAQKELDRNQILHEKEIISSKTLEDQDFQLAQLQKQQEVLRSQYESQWHTDQVNYLRKKKELLKQLAEIREEEQLFCIRAPISGTIEEFAGIHTGSLLQTGQTLAIISPDSEKIAEIYIPAKDIGYLQEEQEVKIQIDAFNYNEWGSITAKILSVSDDYIIANDQPVFKVKCTLAQDYLELKNGTKGSIRKGMTISAHFKIANRTLFQLLYQKADDWFNPSSAKSH